jgi:Tfp pilus assembly protein PilV
VRERGFTYIEALLAMALLSAVILFVHEALYYTAREREEKMYETQGYLFAYSLVEQWKAGLTITGTSQEFRGTLYEMRLIPGRVTNRVEKCEVEVRWESRRLGRRYVRFTGYRFVPVKPGTPSATIGGLP